MTEEQASKVLGRPAARRPATSRSIKVSKASYGATHAATETTNSRAAPSRARTRRHRDEHRAKGRRPAALPAQLGSTPTRTRRGSKRCSSLAITLGLRPGELRKLTWDHVDLDQGSHPRLALGQPRRRHQDAAVQALTRPAQARRRRAQSAQEAPGRRAARGWRRLARQRPCVLPRGRAPCTAVTRSTGGSAR